MPPDTMRHIEVLNDLDRGLFYGPRLTRQKCPCATDRLDVTSDRMKSWLGLGVPE